MISRRSKIRMGLSLIEIMVAVGIIGILLMLLLPAVQKLRTTASIIREKNKVKQIVLALHMFSDNHSRMNNSYRVNLLDYNVSYLYINPFDDILPYFEPGLTKSHIPLLGSKKLTKLIYINQDDPTIHNDNELDIDAASYSYNSLAHINSKSSRHSVFRDGLSNTVEITIHYSYCQMRLNTSALQSYQRSWSTGLIPDPILSDMILRAGGPHVVPPTFANRYTGDVLPGSPEAAVLTFQPRPPVDQCDPRIPQSPYTHGLLAGIADGSVRMISPNISPRTFWAAITPDGGEVLGPDW